MTLPQPPPPGAPPGPPPAAPLTLSVELLTETAAALRQLQAVLKVFGCPIAPADLDRMRAGGVQDRKDDLIRLTANQLTDTVIFARLLKQFLEGAKAKRYPQGQSIELMGRTIGAPVSQRVVGQSMAGPPKGSLGLRATVGGASLKQGTQHTHDKQLSELVAKVLSANMPSLKQGMIPRDAFINHVTPLERCTKFIDPVLLQRVCRDTVRSCPASASLGMDGLRLLSPLADAIEYALQRGVLDAALTIGREVRGPLQTAIQTQQAKLAPILGKDGHTLEALQEKLAGFDDPSMQAYQPAQPGQEGAASLPDVIKRAAAAALGVDLKATGQGNFAAAVYRRVVIVPEASTQGAGLVALAVLLAALTPAGIPLPPSLASHPISDALSQQDSAPQKGQWPPLKPEELNQLADRLFNPANKPGDALPGSPAPPARSPAKLLLTLRGDWVVRVAFLQVCEAALKVAQPPRKHNLELTVTFLKGLDGPAREALMLGLYYMATGDPDQRARQIGAYFADEAGNILKPGLTLGPLRVAFAKHWRAIEAKLFG